MSAPDPFRVPDLTGSGAADAVLSPRASLSPRAPLFRPGAPRWHALRVRPQSEDFVEAWLDRRGVYAFHPVEQRVGHRHGRAVTWLRRYLPGYVFARFPGTAICHAVAALPHITGAVTVRGGQWACLDGADLRDLHGMAHRALIHQRAEAEAAARARAARALRPGCRALFSAGPLEGQECEVIEIAGSGAVRVRLRLFGAPHEVSVQGAVLVGAGDSTETPLTGRARGA